MQYNKYEIIEEKNKIIVKNIEDFDSKHIFECGQCFRWTKNDNGGYDGVVKNKFVNVSFENGNLEITNTNFNDFKDIWFDYFDLGRDYKEIKEILSKKDDILRKAIEFGSGIRILRQEFFEVLISFIISANNRIPMITKVVNNISKSYGETIKDGSASNYSFPKVYSLYDLEIGELQKSGGGFRCKYIKNTASKIIDTEFDWKELNTLSTDEARKKLMLFQGVGPKVADCVLLFSGIKFDVFPTDVWVKKVMNKLYFKRETSIKEILEFSKEYFGEFAGIAQQYLFYYARSAIKEF